VLSERGFNEDDGRCFVRSWCSGVSQEQGKVQVPHRGTGGMLQSSCAFGLGWQQLRNEEEKESYLSDGWGQPGRKPPDINTVLSVSNPLVSLIQPSRNASSSAP